VCVCFARDWEFIGVCRCQMGVSLPVEDGMDQGLPVEILLVEDSTTDLELTLRALKKANLANRIVTVRDGEEALDFLFAQNRYRERSLDDKPRLVLLDLKLPKVDGLEVLKAVKSDPRTRTIPIVVLTSSNEQRDIVESYDLGVNSYIVKPVDFDGFTTAIAELGLYWLVLNSAPGSAT